MILPRVLRRLLNRPTTFAVLYLAQIPLFAFVYLIFDEQFFHSTINQEVAIVQQRSDLVTTMNGLLENAEPMPTVEFQVNAEPGGTVGDAWSEYLLDGQFAEPLKAARGYLSIYDAGSTSIEDMTIRFSAAVLICRSKQSIEEISNEDCRFVSAEFYHDIRSGSSSLRPDGVHRIPSFAPEFIPLAFKTDLPVLFDPSSIDCTLFCPPPSEWVFVPVEPIIFGELMALKRGILNAERGRSVGVRDGFWRMMYLSVVTTTTLGFGDIVPTSNLTRMLVASQSILGVLLIGLFLLKLSSTTSSTAAQREKD